MDRHDVENGIFKSWRAVENLDIHETFSSGAPLPVNEEFRDLALSPDISYSDLYMEGLRLSHYNFCLKDYSYFQYSISAPNHVRYAFYPNPFGTGEEQITSFRRLRELVDAELLTVEEFHHLIRDGQIENKVPLFRYENAPDQWREIAHPCSHLHIGFHSDNRWALKRVLTPLAFTLIILKQYYGYYWNLIGNDERDECRNTLDSLLIAERQGCRMLGDDLFTALESRSFHLF